MMRAPCSSANSTICGDVAARDALGDDDDELDAVVDRLEHRVLGERGRDGDDGAVDRAAVVLDGLRDGVEDRHAVDLAARAGPGVTPPTIFAPAP